MKKLLTLFAAFTVLYFAGCTSKSAAADSSDVPAQKEVSAYLIGAEMSVVDAKAALEGAGFQVLAEHEMKKIGTTIVFTSDALKNMANKPTRGFAAVLRLFVDEERKQISITNPVYFGKAFMQGEYDHSVSNGALEAINGAFPGLKASPDIMQFSDLEEYHFMMGMPYYADVDVLGEGDHNELLKKAQKYKKGKLVIFELNLGEGRTLIGYELGNRTAKFPKKIGTQNSALLPYTVLIEDGKAVSLAAKYYLAVSYPLLSMGEFMTIATVPGAIEKDLKKPYK
jgi:hypothetical protein